MLQAGQMVSVPALFSGAQKRFPQAGHGKSYDFVATGRAGTLNKVPQVGQLASIPALSRDAEMCCPHAGHSNLKDSVPQYITGVYK